MRRSVGAGAALQECYVPCMHWDHTELFVFHREDIDEECERRSGGYRGRIGISRNESYIYRVLWFSLFCVIKSVVRC